MPRVFLDANVLFSAAYREGSGLAKLWKRRGVELVTSSYAMAEAQMNLDTAEQRDGLEALAEGLDVLAEVANPPALPDGVDLPAKDRPILQAAIRAEAGYLLTGDLRHFGPYMGETVAGVTIQTPAAFLRTLSQKHKG